MQELQAQGPQLLADLFDTVSIGRELAAICAHRARLAELEPVPYTLTWTAEALLSNERSPAE
jgi:hypothetical protein